jgi:hypothetical protein
MVSTLKREVRVALSKKAQPVWFRLAKWVVILALVVTFWRNAYFWWGLLAALIISLLLHLFWRWKTKGWTRPWGGWNDLDAGRQD